jgi:hypothetical protein
VWGEERRDFAVEDASKVGVVVVILSEEKVVFVRREEREIVRREERVVVRR